MKRKDFGIGLKIHSETSKKKKYRQEKEKETCGVEHDRTIEATSWLVKTSLVNRFQTRYHTNYHKFSKVVRQSRLFHAFSTIRGICKRGEKEKENTQTIIRLLQSRLPHLFPLSLAYLHLALQLQTFLTIDHLQLLWFQNTKGGKSRNTKPILLILDT